MQKISVLIAGRHSTSITLEEAFFEELQNIADEQKISMNQLITEIDRSRQIENLSSAVRVYILQYLKQKSAAPE